MTERRIIEVVPPNPAWPAAYHAEAVRLVEVFGERLIAAHHIGSTSVPGLAAKPVIDILLEVTDVTAIDLANRKMEELGYIPYGEYGIPGRRFYLKGLVHRTHHVHAFKSGTPDVQRHLAFRDYLIAHPDVAKDYAKLKIECARMCANDNEKYCDGKHAFVVEHERRALAWADSLS